LLGFVVLVGTEQLALPFPVHDWFERRIDEAAAGVEPQQSSSTDVNEVPPGLHPKADIGFPSAHPDRLDEGCSDLGNDEPVRRYAFGRPDPGGTQGCAPLETGGLQEPRVLPHEALYFLGV
jgi:hypothetical protein